MCFLSLITSLDVNIVNICVLFQMLLSVEYVSSKQQRPSIYHLRDSDLTDASKFSDRKLPKLVKQTPDSHRKFLSIGQIILLIWIYAWRCTRTRVSRLSNQA